MDHGTPSPDRDPESDIDQGDGKPPRQGDRVVPDVQASLSPRALLEPRAASKRPASDTASELGPDDEPGVGQMAMLERMHNIHGRTASPAKKLRLEDEERKKPHAAFGGSGSALSLPTTEIGNGVADPMAKQGAVDLTISDDDDQDLVVVQDNSSQMICIGRVKNVYIQASVVPFPDPTKYHGKHGTQTRISVRFRRTGGFRSNNAIMVVDPMGNEFGNIDHKSALGLAPLMDGANATGLTWSAMTDPRRKKPGEGPPGSTLSALISVAFQLYCPRKHAPDVGKFLRTHQMYLDEPLFGRTDHVYWNPQTETGFAQIADDSQDTLRPAMQAYKPTNYVSRNADEVRNEVQSMFDSLANTEDIPQREQSQLIQTPLLGHQKQALHFMWDREQAETDDGLHCDKLWIPTFKASKATTVYVHKITGEEVGKKPPKTRGGILADEMGLGKTLSILALIVDQDSIKAGKEFATKIPKIVYGSPQVQVKNSRATLLVCPLSTLFNWTGQMGEHMRDDLKWTVYHGQERKQLDISTLADNDVVLTTYNMLAPDLVDKNRLLYRIQWFRIVLDEAHTIRNEASQASKAACQLASQRRWAVTGTPVQNRLDDLGALFKFLRLRPFDTTPGFREWILQPFKLADPDVVTRLQLLVGLITLRRMKKGLVELPDRRDEIVRLTFSKNEQKLHDWFEQESSRRIKAMTTQDKSMSGSSYAHVLMLILNLRLVCAHGRDLLGDEALKMTDGMTWDNPLEIDDDEDEEMPVLTKKQAYDMLHLFHETDTDTCASCQGRVMDMNLVDDSSDDDASDDDEERQKLKNIKKQEKQTKNTIGWMTSCYHIICPNHIKETKARWAKNRTEQQARDGTATCDYCEREVRNVFFELKHSDWEAYQQEREDKRRNSKLAKKIAQYNGPHTKTKALLEALRQSAEESAAMPDQPPIKSVVFSCWTTHLDLIQMALEDHGHKYTRLDGRSSRPARGAALEKFQNDPEIRVLLITIGAGGLGLNLTVANKVYVMEPQYNPAAEAQAVDRVHRLGQKREVSITRFIMDGSFEETMLELQRKKRDLADLTMTRERGTKKEQAKERLAQLRSLFR